MSDAAKESGERNSTLVLSRSAHVSLTIGFAITIIGLVIAASVWMTKIADDVGSIRKDMAAMTGQLEKVSEDHEVRIRDLEKRKP